MGFGAIQYHISFDTHFLLYIIGNVDLLSADSVASFSDGSHAVRMPADQSNRPEIIINLRLSSAPIGVYSLHILPHSEAQTKVMVTTELQRRLQMNGFDATYGKDLDFSFSHSTVIIVSQTNCFAIAGQVL